MKLSVGSLFGSPKKKKSNPTRTISRSASPSFGSSSSSVSTPKTVLRGGPPDPFSSISRRDLEALLRRLGPDPLTEDEISSISLADLGAIASGPADGSELRDAFGVFDADGDGKISAEELFGIFESLGDSDCTLEDCRRMIGVVDRDGDGFVGFEDFVVLMEADGQR
ncbi:putative calcium-binding protein CML36 [Iris pallida]|uniref:Calcium-binding protein CML36 n=1 Tax=Iris pallida TaxID=29817 RepID=A0AAX6F4P6_IRIPA|nr:putative calcium-binding protein CML36 [Iris pallida]